MVEALSRTPETTKFWRRLELWLRPEPRGGGLWIEVKGLCFGPRRRRERMGLRPEPRRVAECGLKICLEFRIDGIWGGYFRDML